MLNLKNKPTIKFLHKYASKHNVQITCQAYTKEIKKYGYTSTQITHWLIGLWMSSLKSEEVATDKTRLHQYAISYYYFSSWALNINRRLWVLALLGS